MLAHETGGLAQRRLLAILKVAKPVAVYRLAPSYIMMGAGFSQICQIQLTTFLAVRNPKAHLLLKRNFGLWLCGASFFLPWGK